MRAFSRRLLQLSTSGSDPAVGALQRKLPIRSGHVFPPSAGQPSPPAAVSAYSRATLRAPRQLARPRTLTRTVMSVYSTVPQERTGLELPAAARPARDAHAKTQATATAIERRPPMTVDYPQPAPST